MLVRPRPQMALARRAAGAAGQPTDRPNLVCGPVQVCWEKFARYFDVELRQVPLEPGATGLRPHQLREYVRREHHRRRGDPRSDLHLRPTSPSRRSRPNSTRIQAETGLDVPLHVDAATGGFVAPFLQPDLVWDFRLRAGRLDQRLRPQVRHGPARRGLGRSGATAEHLPEDLVFRVDYLGGDMPTFALNFSRPGGQVVAQYYMFLRLGREGYRRSTRHAPTPRRHLARQVADMGPFTLLYDGSGALPAASWTLTDPSSVRLQLYDLSDQLRMRGWQVPSYPLPPDRQETVIQRVLVRHGVDRDEIELLAEDMRRAITHLDKGYHPHDSSRVSFHH